MTLPNVPLDDNMTPEVRRYLDAVKREIESTLTSLNALVIPEEASQAQAQAGSATGVYSSPARVLDGINTFAALKKFAHYQEQQTDGTNAGNPTGSAWNTRTLNTEVYDSIGASLATDQVTLPAGSYFVMAQAPAHRAKTRLRVYNVTGSAALLTGPNSSLENLADNGGYAHVCGAFTLSVSSAIRLEHYFNSAPANGLGQAVSSGDSEIYSNLMIWQVT